MLVDDASTDGTRADAPPGQGQSNITIVELDTNLGRARARNRGAEAAQSQFLSLLDHDDTYHPDFLRMTASSLAAAPHVDAVKVQPNVSIPIDPVRYEALSNSMITSMLMRDRLRAHRRVSRERDLPHDRIGA